MGKIRVATLGDESLEKEQRRRAEARRDTKKSKKTLEKTRGKQRVEGVGLHGGERVAVVEGTEIKPEFKKLIEEVHSGEPPTTGDASADKGGGKKKQKKARTRSKRYTEKASLVDKTKQYSLRDAVSLVKQTSLTKFDGTVELHLNLNPLTLENKKDMRATVNLPHGTGKEVTVAIADDALVADVEAGRIAFDILVAHPSMMPKLAKVARILGPKGLMPNPKNGTVTDNPEKRAEELRSGSVHVKTEPDQPIIHMSVGKVSFDDKKLIENVSAVIKAIGPGKITKATLTATMGPGIKLALV